jgi:NAD(P)-dependent dehydrogenase (short-subunit alcohol dehydrogenase family)
LSTELVDEGAEVWIADRQVGSAEELAQRLNTSGGKAHAIACDVRSYPSFERVVAEAVQQSGRIDYLFNNAGIGVGTPILTGGKYGRYKGVSDAELLKFWEPFRPMAPEKFAERALRAVFRGDAIIVVPAWWKAWWYLERLSPALSMRAARLALERVRGMKSTTS